MFFKIYNSNIKNLTRSFTFWMSLTFLIIAVSYNSLRINYGNAVFNDWSKGFIIDETIYLQQLQNGCYAGLLLYALPLFTVITAILTLKNDYKNDFYEIEKSSGVKALPYVAAKLASLISVNSVVSVLALFAGFHLYIFSRGGVVGMELCDYFVDSSIRLLRLYCVAILPCILVFITFTYFIGAVFKNEYAAALASIGYIVLHFILYLTLRHRIDPLYFNYLSPTPLKVRHYFYYYDAAGFEKYIEWMNVSSSDVLICLAIMAAACLLYGEMTYFVQKRRNF